MCRVFLGWLALTGAFASAVVMTASAQQGGAADGGQDAFRFRSGVELVNVTATVTDSQGRFVSGLLQNDFAVYDDDRPVTITHFSNERVPVSLGIVVDTSGSMTAGKMASARGAIERLLDQLGPEDEVFLYRFANVPELVQGWTTDRRRLSRALGELYAGGGTAMYDAVADALPLAQSGRHQKKALVVLSDGNDTGSATRVSDLRQMIRQSEVLVYAIGVDGEEPDVYVRRPSAPRVPWPLPFPIPGTGRRQPSPPPIGGGGIWQRAGGGEGVNPQALRAMTDDTGGRTEVVRDFRDLDGATMRIADELSRQYYLGYASPGQKDGQWHSIRVEVRHRNAIVRARKGYVAS